MRSYAAAASILTDRSRAISVATSGVAIGTIMGPSKFVYFFTCFVVRFFLSANLLFIAFQLVFTWIGYPGFPLVGNLHFSMYNAPALLAAALNMLTMAALFFLFVENFAGLHRKASKINHTHPKNVSHLFTKTRIIYLSIFSRKSVTLTIR